MPALGRPPLGCADLRPYAARNRGCARRILRRHGAGARRGAFGSVFDFLIPAAIGIHHVDHVLTDFCSLDSFGAFTVPQSVPALSLLGQRRSSPPCAQVLAARGRLHAEQNRRKTESPKNAWEQTLRFIVILPDWALGRFIRKSSCSCECSERNGARIDCRSPSPPPESGTPGLVIIDPWAGGLQKPHFHEQDIDLCQPRRLACSSMYFRMAAGMGAGDPWNAVKIRSGRQLDQDQETSRCILGGQSGSGEIETRVASRPDLISTLADWSSPHGHVKILRTERHQERIVIPAPHRENYAHHAEDSEVPPSLLGPVLGPSTH
jgi:hypothetical protein